MIFKNFAVLFTLTLVVVCDSTFIGNLPKCHLEDSDCLRDLYESVIRDIGKHGIPELDIPPVDPIQLSNVTVNVLDLVNITLVKGYAKGIKDCIFNKFSINIKEERGHQENTCDITIKGHYRVDVSSPLLSTFLGGNTIHGDGNGKVKIDQLHLKFDFPFYAQQREDGEIYIKCIYDLIKYDYEIGGPVVVNADNLYVGKEDASKQITELFNQNWSFIMSAFGRPFIDKAMEFYFKFAGYFFDNVAARHYIIEDLSPYARP
ncbi:hypothetical protein PYW08_003297 [Mythimna loreyi]|uniref:Uncharacterized protein n=1 Tax=Mythimna loreyi TaxID=667449 RepID=A0ACC2QUZ3_9NEOP|nr:hypothetical protein PYW08_003297 [Mythimna loreyi]